jgi:DNA-binding transcriptional LysR family regulator
MAILGAVFLSQLEGFVEIARLGNITTAAQSLSLSQPALSSRLRSLETELGTELFIRTRRGVRLTVAGSAFLPHAERTLAAAAEGSRSIQEVRTESGERVVLGATLGVTLTLLPRALREFRDANPGVPLRVRSTLSVPELTDLVLRGEVAMGITRDFRHADLERIPLFEDPLVLVVSSRHRLAARARARAADIAAEELIVFDEKAVERERAATLLRESGITPRTTMTIDTVEGAKKLVEQDLGLAILPYTSVMDELAAGSLVRLRVADLRLPLRRTIAVRRGDAGRLPKPLAGITRSLRALGAAAIRGA